MPPHGSIISWSSLTTQTLASYIWQSAINEFLPKPDWLAIESEQCVYAKKTKSEQDRDRGVLVLTNKCGHVDLKAHGHCRTKLTALDRMLYKTDRAFA